jgi:hypothetical protein
MAIISPGFFGTGWRTHYQKPPTKQSTLAFGDAIALCSDRRINAR